MDMRADLSRDNQRSLDERSPLPGWTRAWRRSSRANSDHQNQTRSVRRLSADGSSRDVARHLRAHWLECLIDPGTVVELRAPDLDTGNGFKIAVAGFFDTDHLTAMAVAADHPGVRAR